MRRSRIIWPAFTEFTAPLGETFIILGFGQLFFMATGIGNDFIGNKPVWAILFFVCVWWLRKLYDDWKYPIE